MFNIREVGEYYYFVPNDLVLFENVNLYYGNIYLDKSNCQVYFLVEKKYKCNTFLWFICDFTELKYFNELKNFYESMDMEKYYFLNLHKYFNVKIEPEFYIYMYLKKFCNVEDVTDIIFYLIYKGPIYLVRFDRTVILQP